MFAYTNKDVASLNEHARALHKERGELGEDHSLATKQGEAQFATGDRIQFTGNGRTKAERNAGLTNGRVGTVTALEIDARHGARDRRAGCRQGDKPQTVSFIVGDGQQGRGVQHLQARLCRNHLPRPRPDAGRGLCCAFGAMAQLRRLRRFDAAPREPFTYSRRARRSKTLRRWPQAWRAPRTSAPLPPTASTRKASLALK